MTLTLQTHGGAHRCAHPQRRAEAMPEPVIPAGGDVAVDEMADFGFIVPPSSGESSYLPADCAAELDRLGDLMVPDSPGIDATPDGGLAPILTYWGQFLDHELTARTDRETEISRIENPEQMRPAAEIETRLKNARTPRFDLDSVYGGLPVGAGAARGLEREVATVISGMRHPRLREKMRVGTAGPDGPLPDGLDAHRDLPRFGQVEPEVREAFLAVARATMEPGEVAELEAGLDRRAIIADMRNDENLIVAQFHLSVLRFHNRVVDYLAANDTGWIPDFAAARALTRLHYQWLAVEGYLRAICDPGVLDRVLADRARHFFAFRDAYYARTAQARGSALGDVLPLEFSVAGYRFGHSMVRNIYDYNGSFGRPGGVIANAPFDLIFAFTGGGGLGERAGQPHDRLPMNWVIDWSRFVTADASFNDGGPKRVARSIDTELAPPLADMLNEGLDLDPVAQADLRALFRHLARRNLRRGLSLRLPTGQALHAHAKAVGAVFGDPVADVTTLIRGKPELAAFLAGSDARLHERTPLWFYVLAEAEAAGGDRLGELGSWIVASTFVGVLLSDPDSALSIDFAPVQSPLRMPDGSPVDTIGKWMRFALVLE